MLDPRPFPLDHLTQRGAPDDLALKTRQHTLTYRALEHRVGNLAYHLKRKGLKQGERVATWLPKTELACVLPLAAARAGLIHVPINPTLRRAQAAYIIQNSGARLLVTDTGRAASFETDDIPASCNVNLADAFASPDGYLPPSDQNPADLAAILYTSGSTGQPKGVMLSHANLWLGALSVAHYLELTPDDRVLAVLPLSFDYGQNQLLSTWAAGSAVVPLDYLRASEVVRTVENEKITTLAGVPPLWTQMLETKWTDAARHALKRLTNSGGALTPHMSAQLANLFDRTDIYAMYGLTEAFRSTYLHPKLLRTHPDAMGSAIPFAEVMVVRTDGSRAQPSETGELVHAGPLVAQGYWCDAERTAERFKPAPAWSVCGGTAVWSGDTVKTDANGLFYFVGRDDEMIKTSGNRVSPGEIEAAAIASGVVAEAMAFGRLDERLGAVIILVVRAMAGADDPEQRLSAYLKAELPHFMHPAEIHWRDELPRNANGKLDRNGIKREIGA